MPGARVVREVAGFYEATGEFAVPRETAEMVFDTATRIIGQYTGRIMLTGVQGARISLPDNPLDISRLRLGDAAHTMLLTRRNSASTEGILGLGRAAYNYEMTSRTVVDSRILVHAPNPRIAHATDYAIEFAVHEMGHSWGIREHCQLGSCVMTAHEMEGTGPRDMLLSGRPFCDDHVEKLKIAGMMALNRQL